MAFIGGCAVYIKGLWAKIRFRLRQRQPEGKYRYVTLR
jgi:hypothetical protein